MLPDENKIMDGVIIDDEAVDDIPEVEPTVEEPVEPVVDANANIETTSPDETVKLSHFMVTVNARTFIRVEPNEKALPLCVVNAGSRLTVDPMMSTDTHYRVSTETGLGGFCEKKYVRV